MKRLRSMLLCLLLLAVFAMPVFAAGSVSFSMSASGAAVHRGDTVTISVSVSANEPATSYGLMLSYDSAALELVGGSCTVGGTLVSSFHNGFAFLFQNPTAYSGSVGTVTFRVKDGAAFGSYRISGAASVKNGVTAVSASGGAATITVSCNHSYSSWSEDNESSHKRICTACQLEETANHTWNSGAVTKQPTCKEGGTKTYTCTVCNATKTESIGKNDNHRYGGWAKISDSQHNRTCAVCKKEERSDHTWNSGTVTKNATCKEEGRKSFACTVCNASKVENLPKLQDHTYENACDTTCAVCGNMRAVAHDYKPAWENANQHWHECALCREKKESAAHIPGPEATETTSQSCTVCGYVLQAALGHTHRYSTAWTSNETGHWHPCAGCSEENGYAQHLYGDAYDPDCAVCGFIRTVSPRPAEKEQTVNRQETAVTQPPEIEETEAVETTESTEETEMVTEPTEPATEEPMTTETEVPTEAPTETEKVAAEAIPSQESFLWWLIAIPVAVLILVFFFVIKKK